VARPPSCGSGRKRPIRPGLRPSLAAGEGEPQDRPLHHLELPEDRAAVVGEGRIARRCLSSGGDLGVTAARHVGEQVVLDLPLAAWKSGLHPARVSLVLTSGAHQIAPGSLDDLQLVVGDIDRTREQLLSRGVEVGVVQDFPWGRFVFFTDGNGQALRESAHPRS
jgi:hypothetical protein